MFLIKKLLFKFMELGLGLRTCFSLETRNPIFLNFRLSDEEARKVQASLPAGFTLRKIRFCQSDDEAAYWISYNLYEIAYPKPELRHIRKARCEINTFVTDTKGRAGVYVFSGSPYVSREMRPSVMGKICDLAERAVIWIYGCGKLIPLTYELTADRLHIALDQGPNRLQLDQPLRDDKADERLSGDYARFNDISFFNEGRTFDLVNVNSAFHEARFHRLEGSHLKNIQMKGPFFARSPEVVYFHRGEIAYSVTAMNRVLVGAPA